VGGIKNLIPFIAISRIPQDASSATIRLWIHTPKLLKLSSEASSVQLWQLRLALRFREAFFPKNECASWGYPLSNSQRADAKNNHARKLLSSAREKQYPGILANLADEDDIDSQG
jgi:hypothetical protein